MAIVDDTKQIVGDTRPFVVVSHPIPDVAYDLLKPHVRWIVCNGDRDDIARQLRDADGLLTLLTLRVDDELLRGANKLRVVSNFAVGVDNIDLDACRSRGVIVTNTPDVLTRSTAELAVALLFACARRFSEAMRWIRDDEWRGWGPLQLRGLELAGRRALIVGNGRIGQETARLYHALGLVVDVVNRADSPSAVDEKLAQAQVISLHLPSTAETKHWLSRARIARLRSDCIVINTARGAIVDEDALADALSRRAIFSAGLDVYEHEPLVHPRLRALDNVVLLPHIGSATETARDGMARLAALGVVDVLTGSSPRHRVA